MHFRGDEDEDEDEGDGDAREDAGDGAELETGPQQGAATYRGSVPAAPAYSPTRRALYVWPAARGCVVLGFHR
jgi:hypothetical protein